MDHSRAATASCAVLAVTALAAAAVETAARLLGGPGVWIALQENLFTQGACAAPYLMYRLWERDGERARRSVVLASAAVLAAMLLHLAAWLDRAHMVGAALLAIGLVGLGGCAGLARADHAQRALWRARLASALYLPLGVATAPFFLWLSGQANPVYDLYVFAFEETLGPRFSVLAVRLFDALPPLHLAASLCYHALPLGVGALYAALDRARGELDIALAFVVSTAIGFGLYFVFPVVGPLNVYGDAFPDHLPPPGSIVAKDLWIATGEPRNGMPSLHTAWALLVWINARPLAPGLRRAFRAFAVLNLLATMGLRDAHWLTDLVVGAPLAIVVQALCSVALPAASRARWTAAALGAALIALWFAALWWAQGAFAALPGLSWLAVAATLAGVVAAERGLRTRPMPAAPAPAGAARALQAPPS